MTSVRIGYFEDFKSSDTLLLEADAEGLRALAETFRSLAAGTLDRLALHELPFVQVHHGVQLIATRSNHDRGTRRSDAGNAFLWERDADGWQDAAEKLDVLTQCEEGHHYLDADDDQVVVEMTRLRRPPGTSTESCRTKSSKGLRTSSCQRRCQCAFRDMGLSGCEWLTVFIPMSVSTSVAERTRCSIQEP